MEENIEAAAHGGAVHVGSKDGPSPFVGLSLPPDAKPGMERWMKMAIVILAVLAVVAVLLLVFAARLEGSRRVPTNASADGESAVCRQEAPTPNVVTAFLDVPVTNYVVRRMDVVVEYPVTNYVIKPHVVVVEYPVTNVVVQPYEVVVDYPVTNMVVQTYGVTVEVPVTNAVYRPFADRPAANSDITVSAVVEPQLPKSRAERAEPPPPAPVVRRPLRSMTPYRVVYGDTVGGLARRFGFRISDFRECNPGVDMERIVVGQTLQLPGDLELTP